MKTALLAAALLAAALVACSQPPGGAGTQGDCASCHLGDFQGVSDPPHEGAKPTTCVVCHTQERWSPSVLRHPKWRLVGAHARGSCFGCHRGTPPKFPGIPTECVDCHEKDAEKVTFAQHATFGTKCESCHTPVGWKPARGGAHPAPHPPAPVRPAPEPPPEPALPAPPSWPSPRPGPAPTPTPHPTPAPRPTAPPDVTSRPSQR